MRVENVMINMETNDQHVDTIDIIILSNELNDIFRSFDFFRS